MTARNSIENANTSPVEITPVKESHIAVVRTTIWKNPSFKLFAQSNSDIAM